MGRESDTRKQQATSDARVKPVRFAALRGLYADLPSLTRFGMFCVLLLLAAVFCFSPGGGISVASPENQAIGFGVLFGVVMIAVGVLYLGIGYGTLIGLTLGVGNMISSTFMPVSHMDTFYTRPLLALAPPIAAALAFGLVYALLHKPLTSPRIMANAAVILLGCIVAACASAAADRLSFAFVFADKLAADDGQFSSMLTISAFFVEAQIFAVLFVLSSAVAFMLYRLHASGRWGLGMKPVFQRWLLLFMGVAFAVTSSATYCYETFRC